MIDGPIIVHLARGPNDKFDAIIAADQFAAIRREFQASPEWQHFLDYCHHKSLGMQSPNWRAPISEFTDKFEATLKTILAKHTEYVEIMFWAVGDALYEEQRER